MPHMLRKTMGLALTGLLMMAPISWAAGSTGGQASPGAGTTPGQPSPGTGSTTGQPGMQMPRTGTGTMGQHAEGRLQATVENINQSDGTLELRLDAGDRVQFKVPQGNREILSGLSKGDRVHVAIERASGMQGGSPGVQGGTSGTPGGTSGGTGARPGQSR
jgi:hypothetical protein